ncbi:MAG: hypothetical protein IJH84_27085 [Saccharopolyspora sp.]|uniref:hypothetical protein n=1 Tax=Saccharopolyspora sp. TaxID=33915 RepID=UPI0025E233FA|nr:hypothetical protein [Saccharopolyspora sp.]MBQ6644665.1 hypothetical protein [Saccharopolyspora sp.]
MSTNDDEPDMFQPCDEWQALIAGAHAAGQSAARQLALRSSARHTGRSGSIAVHVEPLASPVAAWLHSTGRAAITESRTGVLVPITVTAADLAPAGDAAEKAHSLLVADAYAVAFSTVLADDAGVATEIRIGPHAVALPPQRSVGAAPVPALGIGSGAGTGSAAD